MAIQALMVGITMLGVIIPTNSASALAQPTNTQENINVEQSASSEALPVLTYAQPDRTLLADWLPEPQVEQPPTPPQPATHAVQPGDTLEKIAKQYQIDWIRLWQKNANIAHPDILTVGTTIVVPLADEQLATRELPKPPVVDPKPKPTAAKKQVTVKPQVKPRTISRGSSSGNGYTAGYCTWYAKNKRPDLPNNLGDARYWVSRAAAQGIPTGSTPRAGAIGQRDNHVVYIESVNGDGTVTISEMNYRARYDVTRRTVPASYFRYIY